MASVLGLVPLFLALVPVAIVALGAIDRDVDTALTRFARRYFGRYVPAGAPDRTRRLRAAYVSETYRSYAAKTYLLTALFALSGAIVGVYVAGGLLLVLPAIGELINQLPSTMAGALGRPELQPNLTERQVFAVTTAGGVVSGSIAAVLVYWLRWALPASNAEVRRRGINEGLPRTAAFVYALSRGGMPVPEVFRALARNRAVYGHGAEEISVAVRRMDLFGDDVITAVRHVSERTPSDQFKTFTENLASVLRSGRNLSAFLREQYDQYQEEALDRQREILALLATIAEAYVTVLVAGTLFLMTILLIFGLTTARTIGTLRLLAYLVIPLANLLFVLYLSGKLDTLGVARGSETGSLAADLRERASLPEPTARAADGGHVERSNETRRRLERYDSVRSIKRAVRNPLALVRRKPSRVLYVTVPLALLYVAVRAPAAFATGSLHVRTLDDVLVHAGLLVIGTFALVRELYSRRIARMEEALPELFERLASLNEAGMSITESVGRVRESDLGPLTTEVNRIWRDVQLGANVDDALRRFGLRVRTTATTRVTTLVVNALRASGSLGPVLRVAAEQADAELRLRRQRRREMFTYLVVIYVSFAVFLVIILAVQEVLVPSLPTDVPRPSAEDTRRLGVDAGQFGRFGDVNKAAYTLVFFHTALIQAVLSGVVAGQLGEGSIKDGAKHAAVMLGVAYLAFVLLSSPVAGVTFSDQTTSGESVVVESASLSDGGFVAVETATGEVIGHSEYLVPGDHEGVRVSLSERPGHGDELVAVPYLDANGDERFDRAAGVDQEYPSDRTAVRDSAVVERPGTDGAESVEATRPRYGTDVRPAIRSALAS